MYQRFILDVDGVLNDGLIHWGPKGKIFKSFGNYDHDGLKFLRTFLDIEFISADQEGWDITESRIVKHMKFPLTMVKEKDRIDYVISRGCPKETVYMGDGPYDALVMPHVGLSIAPAQAYKSCTSAANFVTKVAGGHGAVMEACVIILNEMGIKHEF